MQRVVFNYAADQTERVRRLGVDDVAEEVELACLCRANQAGQSPQPAKIAGIADSGNAGSETRRPSGDPKIAGHRETEPSADCRPVDHCNHDLSLDPWRA